MKRAAATIVVLTTLVTACASPAQQETQWHAFRMSEAALIRARERSAVSCENRRACDRMWADTRQYIEQRSKTAIVRADSTRIETGAPNVAGTLSLRANLIWTDADKAIIRLRGMCRGMYADDGGPGWQYETCATALLDAEQHFRDFLTGRQ